MPYEVPPLPYDYAALEPHIDEATMQVHHDKHHQAYVDKANAALEGTEWADKPIEEVIENLSQLPDDKRGPVRNNGGGHLNHTLFWESMSPDGGGEPDGELADAIDAAFGSFDDFKGKLKDAGVNQFGSGWAWLVLRRLRPRRRLHPQPGQPAHRRQDAAVGVDVWEHAYYLKYQNKRPDYLDAWWNTVDWSKVGERYSAARADSSSRRALLPGRPRRAPRKLARCAPPEHAMAEKAGVLGRATDLDHILATGVVRREVLQDEARVVEDDRELVVEVVRDRVGRRRCRRLSPPAT